MQNQHKQKIWNMVLGLRIGRSTLTRWDVILRHRNHTRKGFGKFFKLSKESAFVFPQGCFLDEGFGVESL